MQLGESADVELLDKLLINPATPSSILINVATIQKIYSLLDVWVDETDYLDGVTRSCNAFQSYFLCEGWDTKLIAHQNSTGAVLDVLIERNFVNLETHGIRLASDHRISTASVEILAAADSDRSLREHLALNPATPRSLLEAWISDDDSAVRSAALRAIKQRSVLTTL
jgi:hypothetical protein